MSKQRLSKIKKIIQENGDVYTQNLAETLGVSVQTIRNDLMRLENSGEVRRFHGGAGRVSEIEDFDSRTIKNKDEKLKLAKYMANNIQDGETIFFDGGTTMMYIIRNLPPTININIVTASIAIANESTRLKNAEIYSLGGVVDKKSKEIYGPNALLEIQRLIFDKAIIGVTGISLNAALTENNQLSLEIKKEVLKNSAETIVLADSSKFGAKGMYKAFDFTEIDEIITANHFYEEDDYAKNNINIRKI